MGKPEEPECGCDVELFVVWTLCEAEPSYEEVVRRRSPYCAKHNAKAFWPAP